MDKYGNRKTIRLGKVSERQAQAVKLKIEDLVTAQLQGVPPSDETSRWVADRDDTMRNKLARAGLVAARESMTLGGFIDAYTAQRVDVKESTREIYTHVRRRLVGYFGESRPLRAITAGDANQWRLSLLEQGLAVNTVRRTCGVAKQFYKAALRRKLVEENPFADLEAAVRGNASRFHYVTLDETQKLLDAALDADWRLLIALARFGGLRTPSESLALRWRDIDWTNDRFTATSSKTEHHEGRGKRLVPIFPELRPYLLESLEQAPEGAEYCITRYRHSGVNLRTQLARTAQAAGLVLWEKPWQNMRSTRETELCETFPAHVVCAWIGNTVSVAQKHYLQVTDDHFKQAAHNPAQSVHVTARTELQSECVETEKPAFYDGIQPVAAGCELDLSGISGPLGLEPRTS